MKCENCGKDIERPLRLVEININPELFLGKDFCNEACFLQFMKRNIHPQKLRGITIHYKTSQEL